MTTVRHKSLISTSAARHTAHGPAGLRKSKKRWYKDCRKLWETTPIVGKSERTLLKLSTQTPIRHPSHRNPKLQTPSNPHSPR